ncbi:hypothetical protein [Pantoea dispersa]|uniref:hypothetical protein n=1 Tax=Pantoea dispersa TaxID=59814 RepID=UPI0021F70D15|nr:hypothetical protein [Pantoea dispersa]UYP73485.1 hypothetical protein OF384_00230 [Pantoea dispersa]
MHSVSFYSFRILTKKGSRHSKVLGDLGLSNNKTAFEILNDFLNIYKNTPIEYVSAKTKVSLEQHSKLTLDISKCLAHGYIKVGKYGESHEIKDTQLSQIRYTTKVDDVTLRERYVLIYLPNALQEGIIAFHGSDNISARSAFTEFLLDYFVTKYQLEARVSPLCHKSIPQHILDSEVKQIKAVGYKPPTDIANSFGRNKTNVKTDLVIKYNEGVMGSFRDLRDKRLSNVIEIVEDKCDEVKVSLQLGNRTIVFSYDSILRKGISVELDDTDIKIDPATGIPDLVALHDTVKIVTNDILLEIHSGNPGVTI